jgi:hypothetical protein
MRGTHVRASSVALSARDKTIDFFQQPHISLMEIKLREVIHVKTKKTNKIIILNLHIKF